MSMKHGYWDMRNEALFDAPDIPQAGGHLAAERRRIKRLKMALVFIRDHASAEDTRLYAASALESDEMLS